MLAELAPLSDRFRAAGFRLYLVGGTVRDLLAGDCQRDGGDGPGELFDFDATTDARPDEIKRLLRGWADAIWTQGERFGTIGAKKHGPHGDRVYEITTHRAEAYHDDSRKPEVEFSDQIEADLSRRDFTINAMALELTADSPTLVDPFGGAVDLLTRTLRTPLAPEISFSDDPLRMLRAARLHRPAAGHPGARTGGGREGDEGAAGDRVGRAHPRRAGQADHAAASRPPGCGSRSTPGLADEFLPELPMMRLEQDPIHRHKDVLTHTLAVMENVRPPSEQPPGRPEFDFRRTRLAALFHDVGKPRTRGYQKGKGVTFHHHDAVGARMTRKRLEALRYSNDDVTGHHRAGGAAPAVPHVRDGLDRLARCVATCAMPARCCTS